MDIKRGDILLVDFGQHSKSSVQSGIRPGIVVSNDRCNASSHVISVCPFTARTYKKRIPTHIDIDRDDAIGYLRKESIILVEQVTPVDVRNVLGMQGFIDKKSETMQRVEKALLIQLGM